jgi:hypothetical protein
MLPNDELTLTYSASPAVAARLSSTAIPAPSASHDRAGCRRRGAWSRRTAIVATSSAIPIGHRQTFHSVTVVADHP